MLASVEATLGALETSEVDRAAFELARVYARQLDAAAVVRRAADKALREAAEAGDEYLVEQVTALRAKLGERECVDRIGARLHALLAELGATPKARAGVGKPPAPSSSGGGALGKLRAVR
ncbi:MAG: hypothetical protein AB7P08_19040 [Burkholderiales bacterium]